MTETSENNKEKNFVCKFNKNHVLKSKNGKSTHEIWCEDNPNKERANNIRKKLSDNHWDNSGEKHPMHGKHQTKEAKQKIREKNLQYHRDNPGIMAGENHPFYRKHHKKETRQLMREKRLKYIREHPGCMTGKNNPMHGRTGKNAPNWENRNKDTLVFNDFTYQRIHKTIRRLKLQPENCKVCRKKTQKLHCSYNLTHFKRNPLYYSLNPAHYIYKCVSCHEKYDLNAFWAKWNEEKIEKYTKNLKILKQNWPDGKGFRIERDILKKFYKRTKNS